jgi:pilus assembly protein CpaB
MGKPIIPIALGLIFAGVAAFMTLGYLKGQDEPKSVAKTTQSVVVATSEIGRGEIVSAEHVKTIEWPIESVPQDAFLNTEQAIGQLARFRIYPNDLLTQQKLLDTKAPSVLSLLIPQGRRAMSIKVNEVTGISGFIAPGSHVDVLMSVSGGRKEEEEPPRTRTVLQDIEVLAIAQSIEQADNKPVVVNTVTLNVTPRDAERLTLASHEGSLHLAMRNDRDVATVYSAGVSLDHIIGNAIPGDGRSVELIRGVHRVQVSF